MPLVRHPRRFKKVCLREMLNKDSLRELVDYWQGKLYIDDDIPSSANSVQPLVAKPKTKFMVFLEKIKFLKKIKKWVLK